MLPYFHKRVCVCVCVVTLLFVCLLIVWLVIIITIPLTEYKLYYAKSRGHIKGVLR